VDDALTATSESTERWPRDLRIFAGLCILWSFVLFVRSIFNLSAGGVPLEDVIFGVKFYADHARVTMALQAITIVAFAIGILMHRRWGQILALLYMAQVIAGHVIFIASNLGVDSQRIHVKIASIEFPVVLLIALYVWYRSRPLLSRASSPSDGV
jgi:hypothetical protein